MPEIGEAIFSRLDGDAALSALVSSRIFPMVVPQSAPFPCVRYEIIDAIPRVRAMHSDPGLTQPRVQFDAFAETYAAAIAIRTAIRNSIQRFRGPVAGVDVLAVYIEDEQDSFEAIPDEAGVYRARFDCVIWHRES